jgi:dienelactone hydrolase
MVRPSLWFPCFFLLGCAAEPTNGEVLGPGVARARYEVRANGTDLVPVDVYFPANEAGAPVGVRHPALVFVQGGFVAPDRYAWQAEALARAGYVVAQPRNLLDLAFFSVDFGEAARDLLRAPPAGSVLDGRVDPARIGVTGHSLGSVVATKLALRGGFRAVALQSGFPDTADHEALEGFALPSLSLTGALDCQAKVPAVRAGWERLGAPSALVVLEGVTHFQFSGNDEEDLKRGCPPSAPLEAAHAGIEGALVAFFGAALGGELDEQALAAVPGATVEVRR